MLSFLEMLSHLAMFFLWIGCGAVVLLTPTRGIEKFTFMLVSYCVAIFITLEPDHGSSPMTTAVVIMVHSILAAVMWLWIKSHLTPEPEQQRSEVNNAS
jgi:hypothetical protein